MLNNIMSLIHSLCMLGILKLFFPFLSSQMKIFAVGYSWLLKMKSRPHKRLWKSYCGLLRGDYLNPKGDFFEHN